MKLYIKTDEEWFITESSLVAYDKKEKASSITVNKEQYSLICDQYDTKVVDSEIVSQTKWDNAKKMEEEKAAEEAERQSRKAAESETPTPTE